MKRVLVFLPAFALLPALALPVGAIAAAGEGDSRPSTLRQRYEACGTLHPDPDEAGLTACLKKLLQPEAPSGSGTAAGGAPPANQAQGGGSGAGEPSAGGRGGGTSLARDFMSLWALDDGAPGCLRSLCAHRPSYAILRNSSSPNAWPSSPTPGHTPTAPVASQPTEMKFQLSFKSLLVQPESARNWQLWAAYTQQSHWQVLNGAVSRPFRETDYEPEIYLNYAWPDGQRQEEASRLRMLGVGLVHQSNGQSNPLSRSWNRVYAQGGFVLRDDLTLLVKAWHRFREDAVEDDNPDIQNYIGRAEALLVHGRPDGFQAALRLRHSLNPAASRGSAQLELSGPINGRLRWYLQAFRGYGETMLDYNYLQTTLGGGIGILDWGF